VAVGRQGLQDGFGVRHLWHTLRVHEAGDLYAANTRSNGALDECNLVLRRHQRGLVLQAVARSDFDNFDGTAH
jgi:hypothetical protein